MIIERSRSKQGSWDVPAEESEYMPIEIYSCPNDVVWVVVEATTDIGTHYKVFLDESEVTRLAAAVSQARLGAVTKENYNGIDDSPIA